MGKKKKTNFVDAQKYAQMEKDQKYKENTQIRFMSPKDSKQGKKQIRFLDREDFNRRQQEMGSYLSRLEQARQQRRQEQERQQRIDAGRKIIKNTITQPLERERFVNREMALDPFGKKWELAKEGRTQRTMPELTPAEKRAVGRYRVAQNTQTPVQKNGEDSFHARSFNANRKKMVAAEEERQRQQQEYKAWLKAKQEAEDYELTLGKGYAGYNARKPTMGKVTVNNYNTVNEELQAGKAQGRFDKGVNPYYMSDEGLQATEDAYRAEAKRYTDTSPDKMMASIYDLTAGLDQRGTRSGIFGGGTEADKQRAAADMDRRRAKAAEERNQVEESARSFFENGYKKLYYKNRWQNEEERPELRAFLYDSIMPDYYEERVAGMTPEQKAELDRRLDEVIERANDSALRWEDDVPMEAKTYGALAGNIDSEQSRRFRLNQFDSYIGNQVADNGEYDPELITVTRQVQTQKKEGAEGLQDTAQFIYHPQGSAIDQSYFWMNFRPETEEDELYNTAAYVQKEMFATPDMTRKFNSFYKFDKEHGTNLAGQYLDALEPYLNTCMAEYKDYLLREAAEDPYTGVIARAGTVPAQAIGGFMGLVGTGLAALGVESAKDPNNDLFYGLTRYARTTREHQNEIADEAVAKMLATGADGKVNQEVYDRWRGSTRFLLGVADSVADNLFAMATGTALTGNVASKAGMAVVQFVMSSEAASNTMLQKMEEGYKPEEAVWYAIGDAIIEWVTERVSLEALLKPNVKEFLGDWKQLTKYMMKTQIAEGSEEIASDMLNWALDNFLSETYNHGTEIEKRVQALVAGGMDPEEAEKLALKEKFEQTAMSGLAGWMSGGLLSGGRVISTKVSNVSTGSEINASNNTYQGESGAQRLVKLGLAMNEDTQSRSLAEQLQKRIDAGEKVSNYEAGKLHQLIAMETSEEQANIAGETLQRMVRQQLTEEGVETAEADKYAGIITKYLTQNGKMNPIDMATLARDARAVELWRTYNSNTMEGAVSRMMAQREIYEQTTPQRSVMDTLGELTGKTQVTGRSALAAKIQAAVRNTTSTAEAIDYLRENNPNLITEEYAEKVKALLDSDEKAQKSKTYLDDVMRIMLAAKTLSNAIPQTNLSKEAAEELFKAARDEFNETDKLRITNTAKIVPGQGTVTYLDNNGKIVTYGTDEWTEGIKPFNKTIRNQMGAVALIAKQFGHRVQFINDPNRSMVNGWENGADGSIVINIANGMKHSMLATIVHEMTHVLEQNSWDDYNKLRQFIVDSLRKNGVDVEKEIMNTILNQERVRNMTPNGTKEISSLSINDAMLELVAKSSENLLTSQNMKEALAKADPSLFNKVKNVVRNIIARINNALASVTGTQSRESVLLDKQTEEIAKLWLGSHEAVVNRPGTLEVTPADRQSMSVENVLEETETERKTRLIDENKNLMQAVKTLDEEKEYAPGTIKNILGSNMTQAFVQWLDHRYPETGKLKVKKSNIVTFINNDNEQIRLKSGHVTEGWSQIKDDGMYVPDITDTEVTNGNDKVSKADVKAKVFGKQGSILVYNDNTKTNMQVDDTLIDETYTYNYSKKTNTVEKVLKNIVPLLSQATYIGSHQDYVDYSGNMHYYVSPAKINGKDRIVVFAVRDMKTNNAVAERAYVARVYLAQNDGAFSTTWSTRSHSQDLHQQMRRMVSIGELIETVNDDRIRDYNKNLLKGKKTKIAGAMELKNFSVEQLDQEYAAAVENGDMETAARLVEEAAQQAGYDTPKLYHGTRYFGFTEFDIGRGEGLVFATSDRKVAESYSGETERSRISDKTNIDANNLHGNRLLNEARKYIRQYNDYKLLKQTERETAIKDAKMDVSLILKDLQDYLAENNSAFDEEKMNIANRIVGAIDDMTKAQSQDDVILAWNAFDSAIWDMKFMDESRLEDMLGRGTMNNLNRAKNWLKDLYYEGELFVDKYTPQLRVYDTQLALETNAKLNQGVYELYGRTDNQLVIDAKGENWNQIIAPEELNLYGPQRTRTIAEAAYAKGYDSVLIKNVKDSGGETAYNWPSNVYIYFNASQVKSADPVTYDDQGKVIPPSERFNTENKDIRYSLDEAAEADSLTVDQGDDPITITNKNGDDVMTILPGNTVAATKYSLSSYYDLNERGKMINALKKAGYTEEEISAWIKNLDDIAAKIASDRLMYDFVADRTFKYLKPNGDVYKKTIDANTMCKKTRLYNGIFNIVQHLMPNTILMPEDLIDLYNMMKDEGLETPCKFCYVQSRRRHLGTYTQDWLSKYKGAYIPKVDEVTTSDGLEKLREEHPQTYKDFVKAMNKKGVNNPKLVQQRTDYRGEIRRMKASTVEYLNKIGGLRIQSFSDFEIVHMLDMMQVVMDMKAKGLAGQAYTKIPEFAWVFGGTGIKINLSLVGRGKGINSKGELVFDSEEGIDFDEAMRLRETYSDNVGTIIVGINDDHIIACMGDSRIDFIIPFHKSGWSENELKNMRGLDHYSDYTDSQNEYDISYDEDGNMVKTKAESNIDPLSYWEFEHDGEYNARKYLEECKKHHIQPKFSQFLTDNGDGSWSLPEGDDKRSTNIRTGYWKTLIDFKMYNNEGKGAAQQKVQPNFNMDKAMQILNAYDGSHRQLPENWELAENYVKKYKAAHPLDNVRTMYSVEQAPDMEVHNFMMGLNPNHMNTEQERIMLKQYQELRAQIDAVRFRIDERGKQIRKLENKKDTSVYDREELRRLKNIQQNDENRLPRLEAELARVTRSDKGFARMMYKQARMMTDLVTGRTAGELQSTVKAISGEMENVTREMKERAERMKALAEKDAVLKIRAMFNRNGLKKIAARLKTDLGSTLSDETIENHLALIALKLKQGEFDRENTMELADMIIGKISQRYDSYILDELRGSTIVLSPVQLKELKGQNRTLAEIRSQMAGTGIRIGTQGTTTLEAKWDSLCDLIPSLNRDETAPGMLDALLNVIVSEKHSTVNRYDDTYNMIAISEKILTAAQELIPEIINDPKSLKLIKETLAYVQEVSGEAKSAAEAMDDISRMVGNLQRTGAKASREASELSGNIQDAITYFNDLAEQSDQAMWRSERIKLIEQLKSENTQNLMAEQAKWKERIERDKTAREMMASNLQLRKEITTNFSRIRKLLINETDQQNIPEHMKSLARYMLDLITRNDLTNRKLTGIARKDLMETMRVLDVMRTQDGLFSIDDLKMIDDEEAQAAVADALADLEDGIGFYNNTPGKNLLANLQGFHNSLERISEAVSTITSVINAERSLSFFERKMAVADAAAIIRADMKRSRFKGELSGRGSKAIRMARSAVVSGNTTPVYFIKNLLNSGMDMLWEDMTQGENRNGLEMQKAKDYIGALAEKTGYKEWAGEKHDVVIGGRKMKMTIENMMELYAIWRREKTTNPEMSEHLTKGGVYIQEDEKQEGKLRHERKDQRAIRVTDEEVLAIRDAMTDAQKEYMDQMVSYLSNEMSALGNEASMRMYGIKKYKESYYFPMKVWDGVKSARSDKGISGVDENRAAHKSWSKRRKHMASNALVIGNFTQDAVKHIVEMINYNTMSPAIENVNKVLNFQFTEGENAEEATKRNMRILFQENYGKEALQYLEQLLKDLNGGAVQDQRKTLRDRLLSVFKKNAVAGSLSVALQQPLSYIRAAMMINPKYLAAALSPQYWKGSYEEMNRHSGVAVIKDMGRFDMKFGQSAKDFITPETKLNVYEKISDVLTMAPQLMDRMTWTRMWTAVKMEQHDLHPEMDMKSDKFMKLVAARFNEVMRRTQVYDSVLVKSSNMRSQNYGLKVITSFMAEPTLSLNVLADAVRNAGQKGGMANLGRAAATFILSAVMQALVKGAMGSGRTPDEKKTWLENFLNKFQASLISELNPFNMISGYSDIVEVVKNGELNDDAMGMLGKLFSVLETAGKGPEGYGKGWYRYAEDTAAQVAQMFTNIPAKNLMRDARAMWNWVTGEKYAKRETSGAVLKYQTEANWFNGDNLVGALNKKLGDAGFVTTNGAYYSRIYQAMRSGNQQEADELREYMALAKGVSDETIESNVRSAAKKDKSIGTAEQDAWMIDQGMLTKISDVTGQYREGKLTRAEAEDLMRRMDPEITEDEIFWKLDLIDYKNETGNDKASGKGYRLNDAIRNNKADEIRAAVDAMMAHGVTAADIKKSYLSDWKSEYLEADTDGKRKIRDALQKAYRAIGYTAEDADKTIERWVKDAEKKK